MGLCMQAAIRITHIMETLARRTGDLEAIIAVKARDLSSPYAFLQIAETYRMRGSMIGPSNGPSAD